MVTFEQDNFIYWYGFKIHRSLFCKTSCSAHFQKTMKIFLAYLFCLHFLSMAQSIPSVPTPHPSPPGHLSFCFGQAANAPRWGLKVRCKCPILAGFYDIRNNYVIGFKFVNLGMRGSCERPLQQTFSPNFKHCSGMKFTTHAASKLETAHSGQTTEYHWQYRTG